MKKDDIEPICTSFVLPGLTDTAEIIVDRWGVPHIYAATMYDAFRVQGFNIARDRLWQIDFWRRRGLGQLAEVFGAEHVERDRAARLFLYRGDSHNEWLSYSSDTKRAVTAFVDGINAYVQLTRDDPTLLPVEFRELAYGPALWTPSDVTRIRSHGLFFNAREELARALTLRDYNEGVEELRKRREPARKLKIPDGLDLSLVPDDVLRVYDLATMPPVFTPPGPGQVQMKVVPEGSNNWVVSGDRTSTGRPMLANDPHRIMTALPNMRYLVHLNAPGLNVIGGGEPALPGLFTGHNEHVAFGLTFFAVDQEDLYVYETNPDNPLEYRYKDRWELMRVERETITVKDGASVEVELLFTRHGPVIYTDPVKRTAFAVRAAWLETGMAPYLGGLATMRAHNWDEFVSAANRWRAPAGNLVYADTSGNIGWKAAGLAPIRKNWDGTIPVPGDGSHEWAGFYDMDELPVSFNPEQGWIATANEMNLPNDYPRDRHIGYDWFAPYRRNRIDEVMKAAPASSIQDLNALQSDFVSIPARRIIARIRSLEIGDIESVDGLGMLLEWDADLRPESAPAALFEVWYRRHLRPTLLRKALEQLVAPDEIDAALARITPEDVFPDARIDLDLFETPGDRLGADPEQFLRASIVESLCAAVAETEQLLGTNRDRWSWGRLHVAQMAHPLKGLLTSVPENRLTAGPLPRGGSGDTVGLTASAPDFTQNVGSTVRVVTDVGDWDNSVAMNAPGQSGMLDDPHCTDLFGPWANGETFPLLYTRASIESVAEQIIRIQKPVEETRSSHDQPNPRRS